MNHTGRSRRVRRTLPLTAVTARASWVPAQIDAGRACDDSVVAGWLARARGGDEQAWDALVEQYAPLIWWICRRYRLGRDDADDVGQSVWMRLVDQLDKIRDPAALPGWLATTTQRECWRVVGAARGPNAVVCALDAETVPDGQARVVEQELLAAECRAALREAFAHLPPEGQRLIAMLVADPPVPYAEISVRLGIPIGSIGPTRSRCLDRMRRYPAIAALINAESGFAPATHGLGQLNPCSRSSG
jgi:RNA polymerase sigma factor (sigma-70 family)